MTTKAAKKPVGKPKKSPPLLPAGLDPLMSLDQVARALGVSKNTGWKMLSSGEFPKAETMIGQARRWRVSTVQKWINDRCEQKGGK